MCIPRFFTFLSTDGNRRLYLTLGYTRGLQIWDTTNFKSVAEVFNVNFGDETLSGLGLEMVGDEVEVVDARVIPPPPSTARKRKLDTEGQAPSGRGGGTKAAKTR